MNQRGNNKQASGDAVELQPADFTFYLSSERINQAEGKKRALSIPVKTSNIIAASPPPVRNHLLIHRRKTDSRARRRLRQNCF